MGAREISALDEQLGFALYAASRAVTGLYRPVLDTLGVTYPQYLVMLVLWDEGAITVKDLGAALHLDYGTLSPLLKRLESRGFVRRERRAADERAVWITPTEQGVALRERAGAVPLSVSDALGLGPVESDWLRASLRRVTANANPIAPEPNPPTELSA